MVKDGVSLLDFNSFPMRIKAVPGKPHEGILEVGHLDALFKRSKGCISPSGWKCDSLPYLVEFDNFGRGPNPNVADPKSMFCWGWDEISWFAQQPEEYRNQWLLYAHNWIKQADPNGHLEMPGTRMLSCPNETLRTYFANTKSSTCPVGYSQEETIKKIWIENASIPVKGDVPTFLYGDGAASPDDRVKKQAGVSTVAAKSDPPASPEVTAAMRPYLDHYKLAGVIGIIADRNGKVRYRNLLGHADVEAKKPISEDNTFWIASMTKMFAGASIMMLVDEGKVSLDDPVTKFIPQLSKWMVVEEKDQSHVLLKPPVRPVTIRHVLSHTSGLAGSSELQQVTGADSSPLKARALSSVTGPLQWQPGDKYAYGNQGMNIAARIVEIVSGMPYEEFLQKRFFEPLGMTETTFWPSEAQIARLAGAYGPNKDNSGYARDKIGFLTKPLSDRVHRFPEARGGLFSTTHDVFRYGLMLANDGELDGKRYLSHAAMDELRTEQTGKTKVNYGLGYHLRSGMFGHDGAYGTDLSVDPKTGMVAIFMVQSTSGDRWAARDLFLKTATQVFPK
jgi:CubicO group peptidase (beta-lactamase class C family)